MSDQHCIIIGNGPAANSAALALRENSPDLRITVIGKERVGYYKPQLLPNYVAGKITENDLYVNDHDFYAQKNIKLRIGQQVIQLSCADKQITLDHKETLHFDGLIIAVGAKPRIPEHMLVFNDILLTLKTVADAFCWRKKLEKIDSVLLVGGDLTSFCVAKALKAIGKKVFFILNDDSFWPIRCTPDIMDQAVQRLGTQGIEVLKCRKFKRLSVKSENCVHVETETDSLDVGAVGAFYGLRPDVQFLAGSGLTIEQGIIVDEYLRTDFPNIYAAGDCAQVYHPDFKDYWVSIGFANAINLGKTAALNLLGGTFQANIAPKRMFDVDGIRVNTSWWTEF